MGIGDWKHWLVILIVVLAVFGTKRLRNLGPDLGATIKGFRKAMNEEDDKPETSVRPPLDNGVAANQEQKAQEPAHKG